MWGWDTVFWFAGGIAMGMGLEILTDYINKRVPRKGKNKNETQT